MATVARKAQATISPYISTCGPQVKPSRLPLPTTRLPEMPPSPPKKPGNISAQAATSSPMPSEIMAKVVPAFLVVT